MSQPTHIHYLTKDSSDYPSVLIERLGGDAPQRLAYIGNINNLSLPQIALFCSKEAPGSIILHTLDKVAEFRDSARCVISGFHSPIEKECLKILLRGNQPIIICPARAIEGMRIDKELRNAFEKERLLILSPFVNSPGRINRESSIFRNRFVAALCNEAFIGYAGKGSYTEGIIELLNLWNIPLTLPAHLSITDKTFL